ncbi:hypothetical protein L6R29_22480 [Myxococcota bacterium]|nr:hypothetical protein [Myxococcota bacterium]
MDLKWNDPQRAIFLDDVIPFVEKSAYAKEPLSEQTLKQWVRSRLFFQRSFTKPAEKGISLGALDTLLDAAVRALDLELRAMLQRAVAKEEASAYMEIESIHDHLFSVGMRALTTVPMDIEVTAVKALLKRCEDKDVVAFFARHKMQDRVHLISEKLEDLDRGLRESNTAPPASPDSKETSEARKQLDTSVRKFRRYLLDRFESDDTAGITFQKGFLDILQRATAKEQPESNNKAKSSDVA